MHVVGVASRAVAPTGDARDRLASHASAPGPSLVNVGIRPEEVFGAGRIEGGQLWLDRSDPATPRFSRQAERLAFCPACAKFLPYPSWINTFLQISDKTQRAVLKFVKE